MSNPILIIFLLLSVASFGQLDVYPIYQPNGIKVDKKLAARSSGDTIDLPISENFANLIYSNIWEENQGVYLNNHFATNQPSIGVLTLDGVNGSGEPYIFSTQKSTAVGIGDYITSKCIDLSNVNNTDGLAFSFFWQQGTINDQNRDPLWQNGEKLRLLFKDSTEKFTQVWPTDEIINNIIALGETADTFYLEHVLLDDKYIHDAFQFKFEYFGTLVGNYGVFSVDNIYLDKGIANFGQDTTFNKSTDYSISLAPRSFFEEYSSIPTSHFEFADESIITDSVFTKVFTEDDSDAFISSKDSSIMIKDLATNTIIYNTKLGFEFDSINNIPDEAELLEIKTAVSQTDIMAALNNTITEDTIKNYSITFSINSPDTILVTDSASSLVTLSNYYAYDDGNIEAGLGVRSVGEFVQAYDFLTDDTLKGFHVFFPKYGLNLENTFIVYKIYSSLEGVDGNSETKLLYEQNDVVQYSSDSSSLYKFLYVPLTSEQKVSAGRYYFGIKQDNENRVLIGLDYSQDRSENIHYRLFNNPWESFKSNNGFGTMALRPVMGSDNYNEDNTVIGDTPAARTPEPTYIKPNPGNGTFEFNELVEMITIYNHMGNLVYTNEINSKKVDLSFLSTGLYIVNMISGDTSNTIRLVIN